MPALRSVSIITIAVRSLLAQGLCLEKSNFPRERNRPARERNLNQFQIILLSKAKDSASVKFFTSKVSKIFLL